MPRSSDKLSTRWSRACGFRGRQRRGIVRTRLKGTNGEEGAQRRLLWFKCCGHGGHPSPLSALSCAFFGQAHAKYSHRWIPPEKAHCPTGQPPEPGPKTPPRPTFLCRKCTRVGRDGVTVTSNGPGGTPARFPPVWVWVGWAGKEAARHIAHPREHPGHKRGRGRRVKRRSVIAIEGVAG